MHVDNFIEIPSEKENAYARFFLQLKRMPAEWQIACAEWIEPHKLFCTYQDRRYRCTGASRMGDVYLTTDFTRDIGYNLRADVDGCSDWSSEP